MYGKFSEEAKQEMRKESLVTKAFIDGRWISFDASTKDRDTYKDNPAFKYIGKSDYVMINGVRQSPREACFFQWA